MVASRVVAAGTLLVTGLTVAVAAIAAPPIAPPIKLDDWNGEKNAQAGNNCYRYAVSQQQKDKNDPRGYAEPGRQDPTGAQMPESGGRGWIIADNKWKDNPQRPPNNNFNCQKVDLAAKSDGLTASNKQAACDNGWKVALVVGWVKLMDAHRGGQLVGAAYVQDYHWYREDDPTNHKWSHKRSSAAASDEDDDKKKITNDNDPENCAKGSLPDGGKQYESFCGYYCVPQNVKQVNLPGVMPREALRGLRELLQPDLPATVKAPTSGASEVDVWRLAMSGEADTVMIYQTPADLDSIRERLTGLTPTSDPMWPNRLGYAGVQVNVNNVPGLGTQFVRVWNDTIESVVDSTTSTFYLDSKHLEQWLLTRFPDYDFYTVGVPDIAGEPHVSTSARPNPFRSSTTIQCTLDRPGRLELRIYDVSGRMIRRYSQGRAGPGNQEIVWDGRDESGLPLAAGTYFYRIALDDRMMGSRKAVHLSP